MAYAMIEMMTEYNIAGDCRSADDASRLYLAQRGAEPPTGDAGRFPMESETLNFRRSAIRIFLDIA